MQIIQIVVTGPLVHIDHDRSDIPLVPQPRRSNGGYMSNRRDAHTQQPLDLSLDPDRVDIVGSLRVCKGGHYRPLSRAPVPALLQLRLWSQGFLVEMAMWCPDLSLPLQE